MYKSIPIKIGNKTLGGGQPLLIQSMTNTDTNNIDATVAQCIRIFDRGADMVRITTQSLREVDSLRQIKDKLRHAGYSQPLVADVHFQPKVAEEAARIVEKVRINPGNYIPPRYSGPTEFDLKEKERQLEKIHEKLLPLISTCIEYGTAIRVGVNHGSLSERILNWYGNTPEGMVASALEFLEIFRAENFHRIVLSLKASSVRLMVQANRLMAKRMHENGMAYPLHLGVTEAGDEEVGRIKSAAGIGTLLADGIGDTLRVSLTEEPEEEIPVAQQIASIGQSLETRTWDFLKENVFYDPFHYIRQKSRKILAVGENVPPVVISTFSEENVSSKKQATWNFELNEESQPMEAALSPDFIFSSGILPELPRFNQLPVIADVKKWIQIPENLRNTSYPLFETDTSDEYPHHPLLNFLRIKSMENSGDRMDMMKDPRFVGILEPEGNFINEVRDFYHLRNEKAIDNPVILHRKYNSKNKEELMIRASIEFGALFLDGFGDGIWIEEENTGIPVNEIYETCFDILQASAARTSKTEYIACPSCGRTLFNIQASLKKVKAATAGYKGLKIAVMGCIVNGPGEMADADFGYVGAGPGKITLYKGKEAVRKNIPEEEAVEELLKLIKKSDR